MDAINVKPKKGLIVKTWERCRSIKNKSRPWALQRSLKSWSWPRAIVAPEGCFSVYVGPQKQRFVIKTEYANHPLFKILLEEAELEYGYNSEGPLALPCNVDLFYKVLVEMDSTSEIRHGCGFSVGRSGSYRLLNQSPLVAMNN